MKRIGFSTLVSRHKIARGAIACITAISFFMSTILPSFAQASKIKADTNASRQNQPIVGTADNGVTVVDIAKPNQAGVSHNKYTDFNVSTGGAVLNNSTKHGQSALGGIIFGNEQLQGKSARIILNEVTSGNRSNLQGYVEVFGPSAQFILANPNGITCKGCGFHNIPRATLSTGRPVLDQSTGELLGLSVEDGDIRFEQAKRDGGDFAVDARGTDYFDVVTRSVAINGAIHGKDIGVYAGRNDFDYVKRVVKAKADNGSGKPEFGIDSSLLGGAYANRITFVGTENGVGMRTPKQMTAGSGGITLTASGKIVLGSASSQGRISIQSKKSSITFAKDTAVWSETGLEILANKGITLLEKSVAASKGQLVLQTGTSDLILKQDAMLAAGLNADGELSENVNLIVEAGFVSNQGGTVVSGGNINISSRSGENAGNFQAIGKLALNISDEFRNEGDGVLAGTEGIKINAATLKNRGIVISQLASLTINSDTIINYGGGELGAGDTITINASDINNTGNTVAGNEVTIVANNLSNYGVIFAGAESTGDPTGNVSLDIKHRLYTAANSATMAGADLSINAESWNNHGGVGSEQGTVVADITGIFTNSGAVFSGERLEITAKGIHNRYAYTRSNPNGSEILSSGTLIINTSALHNEGNIKAGLLELNINSDHGVNRPDIGLPQVLAGEFGEGGPVAISGSLINKGVIYAAGQADLVLTGSLANEEGAEINSDHTLNLTAHNITNSGDITAAEFLNITAECNIQNHKKIFSENVLVVEAGGEVDNRNTIIGNGLLFLSAKDLSNSSGIGSKDGDIFLDVTEDLKNYQGVIYAGNNATIQVGNTLLNSRGEILAENQMLITGLAKSDDAKDLNDFGRTNSITNSSGIIQTFSGPLFIKATRVTNTRSNTNVGKETNQVSDETFDLGSGTTKHVRVREDSINEDNLTAPGQILSGSSMLIDATHVVNKYSLIASGGGDLTIIGETLENTALELRRTTDTTTTTTHSERYCATRILGICFDHDTHTYTHDEHDTDTEVIGYLASTITAKGGKVKGSHTEQIKNQQENIFGWEQLETNRLHSQTRGKQTMGGASLIQIGLPANSALKDFGRSGLIITSPNPDGSFVYESDPRFTDLGNFYGSDKFLERMDINPNDIQKRLGDAYVENRLVENQLINLTGNNILNGYTDTSDMMETLYDNAAEVAGDLKLTLGVALTAEQVAALKKDIIWLVAVEVDGKMVLAPKVYLTQKTAKETLVAGGAIIHGDQGTILSAGTIHNSGTISSGGDMHLEADHLKNLGGRIASIGDLTSFKVDEDGNVIAGIGLLENISGEISGNNVGIKATAIHNETTVTRNVYKNGYRERLNTTASITAKNDLALESDTNINSIGGDISAGNDATLVAGGDINIYAQQTESEFKTSFSSSGKDVEVNAGIAIAPLLGFGLIGFKDVDISGSRTTYNLTNKKSGVSAGGNLTIHADGATSIIGGDLSWGDDVLVSGNEGVTYGDVHDVQETTVSLKVETAGWAGVVNPWSNDVDKKSSRTEIKTVGTTLNGKNLTTQSKNGDVIVDGGTRIETDTKPVFVVPNGKLQFNAAKDVVITNTTTDESSFFWFHNNSKGASNETIIHATIINNEGGGIDTRQVKHVSVEYEQQPLTKDEQWTLDNYDNIQSMSDEEFERYIAPRGGASNSPLSIKEIKNLRNMSGNKFADHKQSILDRQFDNSIDKIAGDEGHQWIKQIAQNEDIEWTAVIAENRHWDDTSQGLSVVGTVVVTAVVTIVTFGAGSGVGVALGAAQGTVANAAIAAATHTLINTAVLSTINNQGNPVKILQELTSTETLAKVAISAVTAGATQAILPQVLDTLGASATQLQANGLDKIPAQIIEASVTNTTRAIISASATTLIAGGKFEDHLVDNLKTAGINTVATVGATAIGDAYHAGDIGEVVHYGAHAALGCAVGQLASKDCVGGAVGAVAGEFIADRIQSAAEDKILEKVEALANGEISPSELAAAIKEQTNDKEFENTTIQIARIGGAISAAAIGHDATVGAMTGGNAAENNALCGGLCLAALAGVVIGYVLAEGDGDPVEGVRKVGAGDDSVSELTEAGVQGAITLAAEQFPDETQAVLELLSVPGVYIDAVVKYVDDETGNVVSKHWNELDEETQQKLAGGGKIISLFIGAAGVGKIASLAQKTRLGKKASKIVGNKKRPDGSRDVSHNSHDNKGGPNANDLSKCFVAGTLIWTSKGMKPIEEIKVGDLVVSRDEHTKQTVFKPVVELFRRNSDHILHLTLEHQNGSSEIFQTTKDHPFYVPGEGFIKAGDLKIGQAIVSGIGVENEYLHLASTSNKGQSSVLRVSSMKVENKQKKVYNFEVADTHTYFVGKTRAWVHNNNGCEILDRKELPDGNIEITRRRVSEDGSSWVDEKVIEDANGNAVSKPEIVNKGGKDTRQTSETGILVDADEKAELARKRAKDQTTIVDPEAQFRLITALAGSSITRRKVLKVVVPAIGYGALISVTAQKCSKGCSPPVNIDKPELDFTPPPTDLQEVGAPEQLQSIDPSVFEPEVNSCESEVNSCEPK
ncbi:MAG: polymorphic toxin-type HINT domain-containing protein [Methyloligellaceae bacterium]